MAFSKKCPRCRTRLVGARIERQGLDPAAPEGMVIYVVIVCCRGCGAR